MAISQHGAHFLCVSFLLLSLKVMEELMSLLGILQMKAVDPVTYYMLSVCLSLDFKINISV